jgi:hypothetical protein
VINVAIAVKAAATPVTKKVETPLNKKPADDATKEKPDAKSSASPMDARTTPIIRTGAS